MIAWSWMGVNILFNWFAQQQYVFLFFFVFCFCLLSQYFFNLFAEQQYLDRHHHVEVYCCQHCQNSSSIFQLKLTVLYLKHKQIIKGIHCSHLHSDLQCTSNVPRNLLHLQWWQCWRMAIIWLCCCCWRCNDGAMMGEQYLSRRESQCMTSHLLARVAAEYFFYYFSSIWLFLFLFYSTVSQRIFSPPLPWIHIIGSVFNEVSISILINSRAKVEQFKKELFIFPGKIGGNFSPDFAQFHLRAFCN